MDADINSFYQQVKIKNLKKLIKINKIGEVKIHIF